MVRLASEIPASLGSGRNGTGDVNEAEGGWPKRIPDAGVCTTAPEVPYGSSELFKQNPSVSAIEVENRADESDNESCTSACSGSSEDEGGSEDDDSLADFIVDDSADEAELRRGSPRRRHLTTTTTTTPPPRPRRRRRMVIESDSESENGEEDGEEDGPLHTSQKAQDPPSMLEEDDADVLIPQVVSLRLSSPEAREVLGDLPSSPAVAPEPTKTRTPPISKSKRPPIQDQEDIENDLNTIDSVNEEHVEPESPAIASPRKQSSSARTKSKTAAAEKQRLRAFASTRGAMAQQWLEELDGTITGGQLAQRTARSGGVAIVWSARMRQTAGQAVSRRDSKTGEWSCTITLSSSLITDDDRLYNTVAHEFGHLAVSLQMGKPRPHGPEFFAIGAAIAEAFPARRIVFGRCHRYDVQFKYAWRCTGVGGGISVNEAGSKNGTGAGQVVVIGNEDGQGCGAVFQRHSKSLDVSRMRCGRCRGRLLLIRPASGTGASGVQEKPLSTYQAFVKQRFASVKSDLDAQGKESAGKEVMRELSRLWKVEKENAKKEKSEEEAEGNGVQESEKDEIVETLDMLWIDESEQPPVQEDEVVEISDDNDEEEGGKPLEGIRC